MQIFRKGARVWIEDEQTGATVIEDFGFYRGLDNGVRVRLDSDHATVDAAHSQCVAVACLPSGLFTGRPMD